LYKSDAQYIYMYNLRLASCAMENHNIPNSLTKTE